jgi:ssDNA-binding Zn-finger/Zn-ribbon topoisomerase 1
MTVTVSSINHAGGTTLANATPRPTPAKNPTPVVTGRQRNFTDDEIKKADTEIVRAFAILGLVSKEGTLVCPVCGTSKRKKVELKTSTSSGKHYWTCHKCPESWGGSAIDLLKEHGGRSFVQAVEELLGLTESDKGRVTVPHIEISDAFAAVVDVEVYDAVRDAGSLEKAQEYYARWHIAPDAVAEAGSTYIEDPEALHRKLIEQFGLPRLFACGVVTEDKNRNPVFLFNRDYPVVEVHQAPSGHVVGMQFRPSPTRMQAVQAHKAWKKRWSGQKDKDGNEIESDEAWRRAYEQDQSVGRKAPYVTPFLSLKGGTPDHLVGCGLKRLVESPRPSTVYVVEGFKDLLAARTIGVEAYAIPGTGVMPPERSIEILRLHKVVVMLDGDAAGAAGREHLVTYLKERGVDAEPIDTIREGLDVADILVERNAHAGCGCETCQSWRASHPFEQQTCPCKTCRGLRSKKQS